MRYNTGMQPHSMCTVALTNYIWNGTHGRVPKEAKARIEYRDKYGAYKTNAYRLFDIKVNKDNTELIVSIIRDGGGLSCTMHARRSSTTEGSLITMTHETQHVSGLREEYNLYKSGIKNGRHVNSKAYGPFEGEVSRHNLEILTMTCSIKKDFGFVSSTYQLELTGV